MFAYVRDSSMPDSSGHQQRLSLSTVDMARGNMDVKADPWEATQTALGAFELGVFVDSCGVAIIRPIDSAESSSA
ncbi:hypothetical protein TSMEX_004226 [Taenia solium]|eukprot:TsM_001242700 transcript=TsM_001242700 gene=TsM_001242700